ncbi:helix-turn-helix transcriptional regulator [Spirulina sp. 06S082]|uniref:helix-turn-helix transcriptional regulator n=1 Tax=Spirulina sp. 06S082 TaxID=3110248 RepID=UPI002B212A1C|nr:helix-turn-helix transcriptional regulator [Spirulina sp. 06S082]MEA5472327.1 helix-turn-helix transcriptional regulator [Spirulina sp. 06S082]
MNPEKHKRFLVLLEKAQIYFKSERQLARQLNVPNSYLIRWKQEKGSPDIEVHERLASLLGLDMNTYSAKLNGHSTNPFETCLELLQKNSAAPSDLPRLSFIAQISLEKSQELYRYPVLGDLPQHLRLIQLLEGAIAILGIDEIQQRTQQEDSPINYQTFQAIRKGLLAVTDPDLLGDLIALLDPNLEIFPKERWLKVLEPSEIKDF